MKVRSLTMILFTLISGNLPAVAQLPDFYKTVSALVWVVDDLDRAVAGWGKAGVPLGPPASLELADSRFRGSPAPVRARLATAWFGEVQAHFLQPLGGENAFTEFLARHKGGVFSLMHRAPDPAAIRAEIERLAALGVGVLQQGTLPLDEGTFHYVFFDTGREGKYVLGLYAEPGPPSVPDARGPRITQFAFAVRNPEPVSRFWAKLGFPEMTYSRPQMSELVYRGLPGKFDMRLGWQRHGKVPYEWIEPLAGPSAYHEHLDKHGEGFHHIAFNVEDMDKAIAQWEKSGFPMSMGGAWGEKGKPGSGRFAYHDTHSAGGTDIELLWNFPKK